MTAEAAAIRNALAQAIFSRLIVQTDLLPGYTVAIRKTTPLTVMLTMRAAGQEAERCFVLQLRELMNS